MSRIRVFIAFDWYQNGVKTGNGRLITLMSKEDYNREDLVDYLEKMIKTRLEEYRICRIRNMNVLPDIS